MKKILISILILLNFALWSHGQETRPNILLIITDQHSGLIMSQQNYPNLVTPGIDKLADQGVTFTRSYCAYPVCQSSRRSMMTGMMPSKCESPTNFPMLGKTMNTAGYETAYFGKWHVGSTDIDDDNAWHGFDTYDAGHDDSEISSQSRAFLNQEHTAPFFMVTSFQNPHDCCELARIISGVNDSYHDQPVSHNMDLQFCPPLPDNFAIPKNEAEGFYGRQNQDPGERYWDSHPTKLWTETEWRQYLYGYDRLVEMVDAHIEELYDELDLLGILENTVIVYTADHGDGHASHRWNQKKTFYEETINVPLIISWKGETKVGYIDSETLSNNGIDLYPTILDLAGVTIPETLLGESLVPNSLQDPGGALPVSRDYIVSELEQKVYTGNTQGEFIGKMLVTQNLKYILFDRGVNREQLFDLETDPGELNPVTDDPLYNDQLISCRQKLKEWLVEFDVDFDVDNIITEYESNASLDGIIINGISLVDFSPETVEYNVELDYTETVEIGARLINSGSALTILQASDLWGDEEARTAEVTVLSVDESTSLSYTITLNVADYVDPESTSTLSMISINGVAISGFASEISDYSVILNFADTAIILATPITPEATVSIIPPSDLWGDKQARTAFILIVSKDGTNSSSYSVVIEISNVIFQTGFIDNSDDLPDPGWDVNYGMMSTNIPGPDDHGLYFGPAAYKFVRGQVDKAGYLRTSYYEKMDSLFFWLLIDNPESTAKLDIETENESGDINVLGVINSDDLSASTWTSFSFEIAREEASRIIFTPTLPYDGDTRLWMDDLKITGMFPEADATDTTYTTSIEEYISSASIFPNPASEYLHVLLPGSQINSLTIYSLSGQTLLSQKEVNNNQQIPIGHLLNGIYVLRIETEEGNSTIKFIKN